MKEIVEIRPNLVELPMIDDHSLFGVLKKQNGDHKNQMRKTYKKNLQ